MTKRKSVSKRIRFEVFKRDKFTCQYCGEIAPNIVLELDHIEPVAKGGTNQLINLITSCHECNSGKSDRRIEDDSVVQKQHAQLTLLQERREQISMMFEWKKTLQDIELEKFAEIYEYIERYIKPHKINEGSKSRLHRTFGKFELNELLNAIDLAASKYIQFDDAGEIQPASAEEYIQKIGGILINQRRSELDQKASYIKGICRNRFSYWDKSKGSILLNNYIDALRKHGWSDDRILVDLTNELQPKTIECDSWSQWKALLSKWTLDVQAWGLEVGHVQDRQSEKELREQVDYLVCNDEWFLLEALEYIGEKFESFNKDDFYREYYASIGNYLKITEECLQNKDQDNDTYLTRSQWLTPIMKFYRTACPATEGLSAMVRMSLLKFTKDLVQDDSRIFDVTEVSVVREYYEKIHREQNDNGVKLK